MRIRFVHFRVLEIGKVRESFDQALGNGKDRPSADNLANTM